MLEKVEIAFRDFISAFQIARLYTVGHARFNKFIDKAYDSLKEVLEEKEELTFGIIDEEIAFEKEILFALSKTLKPVINYLKDKSIERISFHRGLSKEELVKFIEFLVGVKDKIDFNTQQYLMNLGIRNVSIGKIKVSDAGTTEEHFQLESKAKIYEDSLQEVSSYLESIFNEEEINYLNLRFCFTNIMDNLLSQNLELLKLTSVRKYDPTTFIHSLNVSILAMYFSSKLGYAKDTVLDIGVAGLFHDIGKVYISRKIIKKTDKLTDEEFAKITNHVILGAEILLRYVDELGILPVVVCFEHHLKYDLKGYPKVPFLKTPHISSLIISICDVYDALSQRRNYKNDYPPNIIYNLMIRERATTFDPELLDAFFKSVGVWPVGTMVLLSDGRTAVVRNENEHDIFSPQVEIIVPQDKKKLIDLEEEKDKIKIAKYINPWKEGKELLPLI